MKQKLAALKQSAAANQQRLRKYHWTEIQQVTYKGETKPQQQFMWANNSSRPAEG